jgi:hypothetical protein
MLAATLGQGEWAGCAVQRLVFAGRTDPGESQAAWLACRHAAGPGAAG